MNDGIARFVLVSNIAWNFILMSVFLVSGNHYWALLYFLGTGALILGLIFMT